MSRLSETQGWRERERERMTGRENERRKVERRTRKMKQRETDKTRMLKGFQSGGCLGSSLSSPMLKQLASNPF